MRKFYPSHSDTLKLSELQLQRKFVLDDIGSSINLIKRASFILILLILFFTNFAKSQTILSPGDILITSFDASKPVADDKFSFVSLKDLQPNTVIYFTDRGYYGGSSWQAANGSTEGAIEWHLGSDIVAAGTEVVIQGLSAKVNGAAKGTVASVPGSNVSGLSLSHPSGDQIIIFQGGGGNPAAGTMVGGFHYNYCPNGYYASFTTDNGWDNIGSGSSCSQGPSSSNMPPGLTSESTFWIGFYKPTAPQQDIMSYTRGQFNGNGAPFTSLAALKAAIQNRNNWIATKATDLSTPINVPTGISYYTSCTAPTFTFQPSNGTICSGSNTGFTATASNATGYQWQVNTGAGFNNISDNATYSGATTTTLIITGATSAMNGYLYRVVATGACTPNATSTSASLTVNASPAITSQPGAATICSGANTTFTATASNATGYRWQVDQGAGFTNISNGGVYSGATTATLTITGATPAMNGYLYRVVATGACTPNATSNSAALSVNSAPAITSQPGASTICAGANTTFTATASNATGYQWQVDQGAGFTNISNGGVYSGATTTTLTITGAASAMNGYLYKVVATGACTPNVTSNSASLTVNASPAITSQPGSSTICSGANTTFTATASNATGYQWQVDQGAGFTNISNGGVYSGATTTTLTITGVTSTMNGYLYRVVATGACTPNATSNSAALSVNSAPAITSQPGSSTICAGANTTFTATASNATGYQWQVDQGAGFTNISNGGVYSGATTTTLTITGAASAMNGYLYKVVATGACTPNVTSTSASLTVNASPAITSQPGAATICSGANTTFTATASNATGYQWQVDQGAGFTNISNGGFYSGATTTTLTITGAASAMNGYLYRVVATGACTPNATSNSAALSVNSAPAITSQPGASTICSGANTTFTATASNATGYQWQVDQGAGFTNISNGGVYSGATTTTLTITGAASAMNGYLYKVVATGACTPNVTSNSASLTVNASPAITSQPGAATICAGANTTFTATASNATGYQWQVDQGAGFTNISNGGFYSGATTTTLTITGAISAMNGYLYRVVVSGACTPAVTSNAASLAISTTQAPTGASVQSFEAGDALNVLVVNGQNIKWYATENNAATHTDPLPSTTSIVNNTIYYATQTVNGCESSAALAIKAYNETLGANDIKKSVTINIYPNPAKEVLHFSGKDKINKIVILSIDGKKVSEKTMNSERKLNIHTLIQGTYLLNIFTDNGVQTIKFIKN